MSVDNSVSQGLISGGTIGSGSGSQSSFEIESFPSAFIQPISDTGAGTWLGQVQGGNTYAYKAFCWVVPILGIKKLLSFKSREFLGTSIVTNARRMATLAIWGGKLNDPTVFANLVPEQILNVSYATLNQNKMIEWEKDFVNLDVSAYDCLKIAMSPAATVTDDANIAPYEPIFQANLSAPLVYPVIPIPDVSGYLGLHNAGDAYTVFPAPTGDAQDQIIKWMKIGVSI